MPMLAAGNFDPQVDEQPEKLDLEAEPARRLSAPGFISA